MKHDQYCLVYHLQKHIMHQAMYINQTFRQFQNDNLMPKLNLW